VLRRGFKAQSERRSVELRKKYGLHPDAPLSARQVATDCGILVWTETDVEGVSHDDLLQLTVTDSDSWSAFTMRVGENHLIVVNSSQTEPRQNSVIMHELSHIMLGHELTSAGLTADGHFVPTSYNQDQEDEADWLAGTLLLPRPALLRIRNLGMTDNQARNAYQVSGQMLKWRVRMTGVDYQIANARKWRTGS
jgi:Zn-dependent peptidase ImmA (M78 family)